MGRVIIGHCHGCGRPDQKLTNEHIPPLRVQKLVRPELAAMHSTKFVDLDRDHPRRLPRRQPNSGGMRRQSFCGFCQNWTQKHYGLAFYEWTCQALRHAERVGDEAESQLMAVRIKPLNVLKQIVTMTLAAAHFNSHINHHHLRRFIHNRDERHLPTAFEFYTYLNPERKGYELCQSRMEVAQFQIDVTGTGTRADVLADIAFPPLGYLVVYNDDTHPLDPAAKALTNISHWGHFRYGEETEGWLRMPVRTPFGPFALRFWQDAKRESVSA